MIDVHVNGLRLCDLLQRFGNRQYIHTHTFRNTISGNQARALRLVKKSVQRAQLLEAKHHLICPNAVHCIHKTKILGGSHLKVADPYCHTKIVKVIVKMASFRDLVCRFLLVLLKKTANVVSRIA